MKSGKKYFSYIWEFDLWVTSTRIYRAESYLVQVTDTVNTAGDNSMSRYSGVIEW